jgi:hypothetical protein
MSDGNALIPVDDVSRRLGLTGQTYVGIRAIPIDRIIGTLDRNLDFDRSFRPRRGHLGMSLSGVRNAFPSGDFPSISVFEIGGSYFVSDGHKRVAAALEMGKAAIDAEVIRIETGYELPSDVDVRQLIHTEQHRIFMEQTGLEGARPDAVIEFSRPQGYRELLEIVKAYGYDLMQETGSLLEPRQVAADWHDNVYLPGLAALREEDLPADYAYKTDADLFLWIYKERRDLLVEDVSTGFSDAARAARGTRVSRRFKRALQRERRAPLRRRAGD